MISIKGIFDGKRVKLLEKVDINVPQEVIITFLGTSKDESLYQEIYKIGEIGKVNKTILHELDKRLRLAFGL